MKKSIGFIGGGRVTRILLEAFRNAGFIPSKIVVYDLNNNVAADLQKQFQAVEIASLHEAASQDMVFIALHPPVIMDTLELVKEVIKAGSCVISLAPKITIEKISDKLNGHRNIARMIPNATSFINKGYNPVCFSKDFSEQEEVLGMLKLLGDTFLVAEPKMEAYAIVSAMLPTYFWFQWQEMERIGIMMGLDEKDSKKAIEKTLVAAIETFYHSGLNQEEVIDLIPVKPIAAYEGQIKEIYSNTLNALFEKIKPPVN